MLVPIVNVPLSTSTQLYPSIASGFSIALFVTDAVTTVPKVWFSTVFAVCNTLFVSFSK